MLAVWIVTMSYMVSAAENLHLSQDEKVRYARGLIHNGLYYAALDVLRPLVDPARPDIIDIRFLIGISAITVASSLHNEADKIALLNEAITALRDILAEQPQLVRVRLELARAFFLKGDDNLSRQHFERVLAGNPVPAIASNIRHFLNKMRARRRWSNYLTVSIEQNDNVNNGAHNSTFLFGGAEFVRSEPQLAIGVGISTGADYNYPLNQSWHWRTGVDLFQNEYEDSKLERTYLGLRSGPRWLISRRSEASLQAIGGFLYEAGESHSREAGARVEFRQRVTPRFSVNTHTSWKQVHYRFIPENRSGNIPDENQVTYELNGSYLFSPVLQGTARIGRRRDYPRNGNRHDRTRTLKVGLNKVFSKGWTVGISLEQIRDRYGTQRNVLDRGRGELRKDRRMIEQLSVLNRKLTVFGFSPQLVVTADRQESNIEVNKYKRTRADLRFVRQF